MSTPAKMVKVTVDGRSIEVEEGLPLIEAAARLGIDIPRFCYHSHLPVAGNCRMCAVEVEKARGLPISCATPCAEGMVAKTDTDAVKKHRAAVMEFLLVNHPIDCPICDQAGECWLQKYYMDHDLKPSRLEVDKVHYAKRVAVGPRVVLDQERCVECTRCIRFCDEVTHTGELNMVNRGDRNVISTFPGVPLDNPYSVNVADICPVGALTQTDFRFKARVWFLKEAPTICPGCSRGCNVTVDYGAHDIVTDYNGKAYRLRPRVNDEVNKAWMCDFGRNEYQRINDGRVEGAKGPDGAGRSAEIASRISEELRGGKGEEVLVVGSFESTVEEMWSLRRLGEEVLGGARVVCVADRPDGFQDDFLIRADKHPNRKGAEMLGILGDPGDLPGLLEGKKAVVIHRADVLAFDTDGRIRAALEKIPLRVVIAANQSRTTELATHLFASFSFLEKDGHWVNFEGRVQRIKRGVHLKPDSKHIDDLTLLSWISGGRVAADPKLLYSELSGRVEGLHGLTWDSIGSSGRMAGSAQSGAAR